MVGWKYQLPFPYRNNQLKHEKMRIIQLLFLTSFLLLATGAAGQQANIIPLPSSAQLNDTACRFHALKYIVTDRDGISSDAASLLQAKMQEMGISTTMRQKDSKGCILFQMVTAAQEAYTMEVKKNHVTISASTREGFLNGMQSLLQEMRSGMVPCGLIQDAPRFGWRGFMLDEARHFVGEEKVKQLLDILASYKINRFHWHLTDAQGWRIEIKAYPRLTEVGAIGNHTDANAPAAYYTQQQIRDMPMPPNAASR